MKEYEITKTKLSDLYSLRDELKKKLEKNPDDWESKHCLESVRDEIKSERQRVFEKEQKNLQDQGIIDKEKSDSIANSIATIMDRWNEHTKYQNCEG